MAPTQSIAAAQQQTLTLTPPAAARCRCPRHLPPAAAATARHQRRHPRRRAVQLAALAAAEPQPSSGAGSSHTGLHAAKQQLLAVMAGTDRGGEARGLQRGLVEEAQVSVESFSPPEIDFSLLQGWWRLEYTTARDVLPLVAPPRLPAPLQVGRIWQRFSGEGEGVVQNVIEAVPPTGLPLSEGVSAKLVVEAGWEVRTAKSIALTFREAGVEDVQLGPGLQNLLASPILPRGWWNQQLLLAIKQLSVRVPLTTRPLDPSATSSQQRPVGINYMLTFLDEDMLIGRAQGNGGTFIFTRDLQQQAQEQRQEEEQAPRDVLASAASAGGQ